MSSTPTSKRKHVTTACVPCRESKVKCDGTRPFCSNCQNKGKTCQYQIAGDKRKISLRVAIDLLSNRVDQLCRFVIDNGLQLPSMSQERDIALKNVIDSLGLAEIGSMLDQYRSKQQDYLSLANSQASQPSVRDMQLNDVLDNAELAFADDQVNLQTPDFEDNCDLGGPQDPTISTIPIDTQLLQQMPMGREGPGLATGSSRVSDINKGPFGDNLSFDLGWDPPIANDQQPPNAQLSRGPDETLPSAKGLPVNISSRSEQSEIRPAEDSDEAANDSGGTEELVNQLSARLGALQFGTDGQFRYYGPTSNFNLLEMPVPDNQTIHRTLRKDGHEQLQRLGIDKEVPMDIEEHLIQLYFTWHDPALHVVDREMYEQAKKKWRIQAEDTTYYSEALTNAMCCLGAAFEPRYHPTFVTFPKSLSDFFADRAKALLEIELDSPSVATIQAMVVLSGHDIGCKRDARGWLYSGMAMRLVFGLGLHMDMTPYVAKGYISEPEAELRRTVFWGSYAVDHLLGFYVGRPVRMNMEDVTVEKPGRNSSDSHSGRWVPYALPGFQGADVGLVNPTELLSKQQVLLCEIMAPLGHILYGCTNISKHALQSLNATTTDKLLKWKEDLPPILQVDVDDIGTPYLPHVLLLHLQYYQHTIHAHRPWMSKRNIQPQPPQGSGPTHARKMCIESAISIVKLLQLYETRYTFRRMNIQAVAITCSAALMLIFAAVSNSRRRHGDDESTSAQLGVCFRALDEFSLSWENAKRARDFLLALKSRWEARVRTHQSSSTSSKRLVHGSGFDPGNPQVRKKTRRTDTSNDFGSEGSSIFQQQRQQQSPQSSIGSDRVDSETMVEFDWLWATNMQAFPRSWDPSP